MRKWLVFLLILISCGGDQASSEPIEDISTTSTLPMKYNVVDYGNCIFVNESVLPDDPNYNSALAGKEAFEKRDNLRTICLGTSTTTVPRTTNTGKLSAEMVCLNTEGKKTSATIAVSASNSTDKLYGFNVTISPGYNENFYIGRVEKGINKTMTLNYEYDAQESSISGKNYFTARLYSVYTNPKSGKTTQEYITQCTFDRNYSDGQTSPGSTQPTTTTTTVPRTTTTTTMSTTTTTTTSSASNEGYGLSVFETQYEYHQHILNLTFYEGLRGYEGDPVINNGWENERGCDPKTSYRGCRTLYQVYPPISILNLSLPNSGGNRAFGEVSVSHPEDYYINSISVTLQACSYKTIRCINDYGVSDYEVRISDYDYRGWKFGEVLDYIFELVGKDDGPGKDTNFFYPGYYYFVDKIALQIVAKNDPLEWSGILEYRVVGGVGTYAWQIGWDAPSNLGWVNPDYNFLWSSLDIYENTPYFAP